MMKAKTIVALRVVAPVLAGMVGGIVATTQPDLFQAFCNGAM